MLDQPARLQAQGQQVWGYRFYHDLQLFHWPRQNHEMGPFRGRGLQAHFEDVMPWCLIKIKTDNLIYDRDLLSAGCSEGDGRFASHVDCEEDDWSFELYDTF